jgi:endoglucanase
VVYTFHVYEPWVFTHQGVPWGPEKPLAGLLPYPSDSTVCKPAPGEVTDSIPLTDARDYCAGRWDAGVLAGLLDRAVRWRQRHGVPLFAGELGAYCAAPTPDRLRWFRDVRRGLEQRQIGWALWEWEGCFGLHARHSDAGRLVLDTGRSPWRLASTLAINPVAQ